MVDGSWSMVVRPGIEKFKKWSTYLADACTLYGLLNFMKVKAFRVNVNFLICLVLLVVHSHPAAAQKIQYCRENVYITNPDNLKLVANIAGKHHLLSFNKHEKPEIFIFNDDLELEARLRFPFSLPDQAESRLIPFDNYYYLYLRTRYSRESFLWKIDAAGKFTNLTLPFRALLASQVKNVKLGFQLIANGNNLWMVYHTDLDNTEKKTLFIVQADSALNVVFSHKVQYAFNRYEEKIHQELLMFGRNLLVLKTLRSGTALELMKVNLATGYSISNIFESSGYFYSQASFHYTPADSSITVSSILTEPTASLNARRFIFISRVNKILAEAVPFKILKSQFVKNTGANFLQVNGHSRWMRLRNDWYQANTNSSQNIITLHEDLNMPQANAESISENNRLLSRIGTGNTVSGTDITRQNVRFSLLDDRFGIARDTILSNTSDARTVHTDRYLNFEAANKEFLLFSQQFGKRRNGLLLVNADDSRQIIFTDLRVYDRNYYRLSKAQLIFKKGIIIPYTNGREAGLVKITVE
jgi:hypothetical protein